MEERELQDAHSAGGKNSQQVGVTPGFMQCWSMCVFVCVKYRNIKFNVSTDLIWVIHPQGVLKRFYMCMTSYLLKSF